MESPMVKTQKAEIPSFDGWRYIGFVVPKDNLPCSYPVGLSGWNIFLHEADDTDFLAQICYRKVEEK